MINLISGIIVTEGNKTISSAYNKFTSNRHRSTGSRFLSSYSWKNACFMQYYRKESSKKLSKKFLDKMSLQWN